ncbi:MAG TPA: alpha-isopropylmalate synthase regulatory domain-containing protein [Kofleriaceae bacterium]|nr:alpha-isopropylmalate synthase regulatory domain-containing protein [Kofleriaceae bacterium]
MTRRPQLNSDLIRRVLGNDYLELTIVKLILEESLDAETSKVKVDTVDTHGNAQTVEGEGCGMVDALLSALFGRYALEYQSLETIELANFSVGARLDTKNQVSGADSVGEVMIDVRNSDGAHFLFADASRSIATSTARAVIAVVEYFVNAERAFIMLYKSLEDAKERNREDLVTRYTRELAEVVKSTSYTEVLETMKKTAGV